MGAICNGMALHGLTRPYGGTFLVFSDYMRPSVRLAALMGLPVTFVWTHDSIGLGEDGPTHQPVEHLWALRAIPASAWSARRCQRDGGRLAGHHRALRARRAVPDRQNIPVLDRSAGNSRGLANAEGSPRRLRPGRGREETRGHPDRHGQRGGDRARCP